MGGLCADQPQPLSTRLISECAVKLQELEGPSHVTSMVSNMVP